MKKILITTTALFAFLLPTFSAAQAGGNVLHNMTVKGMMCSSCAARTKNVLKKINGVKAVSVDLDNKNVAVCATPNTKFTEVQLKKLFLSKGFTYKGRKKAGTC